MTTLMAEVVSVDEVVEQAPAIAECDLPLFGKEVLRDVFSRTSNDELFSEESIQAIISYYRVKFQLEFEDSEALNILYAAMRIRGIEI